MNKRSGKRTWRCELGAGKNQSEFKCAVSVDKKFNASGGNGASRCVITADQRVIAQCAHANARDGPRRWEAKARDLLST